MRSSIAIPILFSSTTLAAPGHPLRRQSNLWQPAVGTKWQIVISQPVNTNTYVQPTDAPVIDVDLFYTTAKDISRLKQQGKSVICYFSAGSSENWRSDYGSIPSSAKGSPLEGWAGENWLNVRSSGVLNVMKKRIDQAAEKGCDAIDPDNMDAYGNGGGGFGLTQSDAATYLIQMAQYAASLGLSTGLKNAQEIISRVQPYIQFAVNEECFYVEDNGCAEYNPLIRAGKAVFHIEYLDAEYSGQQRAKKGVSAKARKGRIPGKAYKTAGPLGLSQQCGSGTLGRSLSTVIKYLALDGYVKYCDGSTANTAINENYQTGDPKQGGGGGGGEDPNDGTDPGEDPEDGDEKRKPLNPAL